jgi:hypothetical protein
MTTPHKLDVTFTVPIEKDGAFPTYLTVPDSLVTSQSQVRRCFLS